MPIPYCTVHERLFDPRGKAWMTWSQDYVTMVQHVCGILDSAHIDASDYKVINAACDQCQEVIRKELSK
jgi:hypothetical protein